MDSPDISFHLIVGSFTSVSNAFRGTCFSSVFHTHPQPWPISSVHKCSPRFQNVAFHVSWFPFPHSFVWLTWQQIWTVSCHVCFRFKTCCQANQMKLWRMGMHLLTTGTTVMHRADCACWNARPSQRYCGETKPLSLCVLSGYFTYCHPENPWTNDLFGKKYRVALPVWWWWWVVFSIILSLLYWKQPFT